MAFESGELSYSKVRVLARVAEPDSEADLLELARHATAAQLERMLQGVSPRQHEPRPRLPTRTATVDLALGRGWIAVPSRPPSGRGGRARPRRTSTNRVALCSRDA